MALGWMGRDAALFITYDAQWRSTVFALICMESELGAADMKKRSCMQLVVSLALHAADREQSIPTDALLSLLCRL